MQWPLKTFVILISLVHRQREESEVYAAPLSFSREAFGKYWREGALEIYLRTLNS